MRYTALLTRTFLLAFCPALLTASPAPAPENTAAPRDDSLLTLERIYDSGDFRSKGFSAQWLDDSSGYVTWESSSNPDGGRDLVLHPPGSDKTKILIPAQDLVPPGQSSPLSVSRYAWSKDHSKILVFTNTKKVWRAHTRGDYWLLDRSSHELWQIAEDLEPASLMFAKFSPTGDRVAFVHQNNIYVQNLHNREITPLTKDGSPDVINGTFDWVYEEEFRLRDGFRWSPDGESIAYWQLDTRGERRFPLINHTDSLYPAIQWIQYPKVGEVNASARVGVVDLSRGNTVWMQVPGDPRQHYIHDLDWPDHSDRLILQQLNRLQNHNRIFAAHPETGEVDLILSETDEAWLDSQPHLHWLKDGSRFLWLSDRTGWRHLYQVSAQGRNVSPVTEGDFDVIQFLGLDEKEEWAYFLASPRNPTQRYLYRARLGRTKIERLTPKNQPGSHRYNLSPDGQWAIHSWSRFGSPPTAEFISLPDHENIRTFEDNQALRDKLTGLKPVHTELFRVNIDGDALLDGWCIRPDSLKDSGKYPLLIYVYGEPAGQTVQDRWGGSGFLWHMMLAQQGYVVMSFDNRGTPAPRGRAWRKSVYRQIGILAPKDQAGAVRQVLQERDYLDDQRVGIWGWSGGGSSTLHALFKYPDLYHAGIAIAAVPNQRLYDTIYQERYMGLPKDNVEGFLQGSPVNFAKNLQGHLLLIHGTGDDNVHYQGAEVLINELIRHGKQFQVMPYPNRSHGISEGTGTTMHLRTLMLNFLHQNLPPGPVTQSMP